MQIFANGSRDIEDVRGVLKASRELVNMALTKRLTTCFGPREHSLSNRFPAEL